MGSSPTRPPGCSNPSQPSDQEMTIFLKVSKIVAFNVKKSETVKNLKTMMREKEGILERFQELFFSGERLKDDKKLVDCGIEKDSTLHLFLQNLGIIKLSICIPSKKKLFEVEAKVHDTIQSIKSLIQVQEGIYADQFTLFHAGMRLNDCRTLSSLGIKGESTLHLVFDPKDAISISVKLATGKIVRVEVKLLYTVGDVKAIVWNKAGVLDNDQTLAYSGNELEDSRTLASYNIKEESILEMVSASIQIFVKPWSGNTITLCVSRNLNVAEVKKKIFSKLGIPYCDFFYLKFAQKRLEGGGNLASYGIKKDSTLYLNCSNSCGMC